MCKELWDWKEEGYGLGKEGWDGVVINEGCNI